MSITDVNLNPPPAARPSRREAMNEKATAYLAELDRLNGELEHYQNEEQRLTDALNRERHARQIEAGRADSEIKVLREQLAKAEYERDFFHTQAREFVVELRRMEETVNSIFARVGKVSAIYERNAPNVVARLARMAAAERQQEQPQEPPADASPPQEGGEQPQHVDQPTEPRADGAGTVDDGAPAPTFLTTPREDGGQR